jgi:hypothetical protein
MQFLLFDVSSALVFLAGYVAVVALRQHRAAAAVGARARPGASQRYR